MGHPILWGEDKIPRNLVAPHAMPGNEKRTVGVCGIPPFRKKRGRMGHPVLWEE